MTSSLHGGLEALFFSSFLFFGALTGDQLAIIDTVVSAESPDMWRRVVG